MSESTSTKSPAAEPIREMTPDEIREAFHRYDLIIGLFVILMGFFAASFVATAPDLWLRAASGEALLQTFPAFPQASHFAYTADDSTNAYSGVDPSWLYNVASALLLRLGDVPLVLAKIACVVIVVALLLTLRLRNTPASWVYWCVGLAIVSMSDRLDVSPTIASYLLLATLLFLGFRAQSTGSWSLLYFAIPLLILWANLDLLFPLGGVVLLAFLWGDGLWTGSSPNPSTPGRKVPLPLLIGGTIASLAAGIVSPFLVSNWMFPWRMVPAYRALPALDAQWQGWYSVVEALKAETWTLSLVAWILLALLAAGVILLSFERISITRILLFIIALALGICERWLGVSGILLCYVASTGGQALALRYFPPGVRTSGWGLIRAQLVVIVLLIGVFVGMIAALTGRMQDRIAQFGFGIDRSLFIEETAAWLKESGLRGKSFAVGPSGRIESYLAFSFPEAGSFVDLRWPHENDAYARFERLRISLAGLDPSKANDWKETFKQKGITHLIVDTREETDIMRVLRQGLSQRSDLAPLHVDDQAVVYGWLSDDHADYARVKELRLSANALAFRTKRDAPPPTDRMVTSPGLIDRIWPIRMTVKPPGLYEGTFFSTGGRWLSQPGASQLAVAKLRSAVSANPDNPDAHLRLGVAYMTIIQAEIAQLGPASAETPGPTPSPEGSPAKEATPKSAPSSASWIPSDTVLTRHQQAMTSLQNALLAGADQWSNDTGLGVHTALAVACRMNRFMDLWLEHVQAQKQFVTKREQRAVIDAEAGALVKDVEQRLDLYRQRIAQMSDERRKQADQLETEVQKRTESLKTASDAERKQLEAEMTSIRRAIAQLRAIAETDRPIENAQIAFGLDLPGKSLEEIEKIPLTSPEAEQNVDFIARVYLRLGYPEKAAERLRSLRDASALGARYFWLLAQTQLTSGQLEAAQTSLERAIAESQSRRVRQTIDAGLAKILQGRMLASDGAIPLSEAMGLVQADGNEASFLFDLALVQLELAQPAKAAESFARVVEIAPGFKLTPIMDYYVREITGKPLPKSEAPSPENEIALRFPDPPPSAPTPPPAPATGEPEPKAPATPSNAADPPAPSSP